MAYTWTTLGDVLTALAGRLYDPTFQRWTQAELTLYFCEVLQEWNAFTGQFRKEFTFTGGASTWIDITRVTGTPRAMTTTDLSVIQLLEYHLQEPQTPTFPLVWTGSSQFTATQLQNSLVGKTNDILRTTTCTLTDAQPTAAVGVARTVVPDTTERIVRVAWLPFANTQGYVAKPLGQVDVWGKRVFRNNWTTNTAGTPRTWMQSTQPPLSFDVDVPPPVTGVYDLLLVQGIALSPTQATVLPIPNDWSWIVKWGALKTLLGNESDAKDVLRADYAAKRYEDGLKALRVAPAVLEARINGLPVRTGDVRGGDNFNVGWQGQTGTPARTYQAGLNLCAVAPSGTPATIFLNVVENAPLPTSLGDYVQISREDLTALLDECQHLAMFKIGGGEFENTFPLHANFMSRVAQKAAIFGEQGEFYQAIMDISQRENEREPLEVEANAG